MTEQEVNIECAKLDGWTFVPSHDRGGKAVGEYLANDEGLPDILYVEDLNYTTSYDAIIPLMAKQSQLIARGVCTQLDCDEPHHVFNRKPKPIAIALLKALGKWNE